MRAIRFLHILKIILYVFAAVILILGLLTGISLISGAANIHNVLMPFQLMGAEAVANLITPYLTGLISGLGVFVLIVSLVLSLILFGVGWLVGYSAELEARVVALESYALTARGPGYI